MALVICKDCKKEFSTDAKRCPHCGARKKRSRRLIDWLGIVFFIWIAVYALLQNAERNSYDNSQTTSSQVKSTPLNYSMPILTTDHAIICPQSLFSDMRGDHGPIAIENVFLSIWNRSEKAKALGCEEVRGGIPVYAHRMEPPYNHYIGISFTADTAAAYFTMEPYIINGHSKENVVETPALAKTKVNVNYSIESVIDTEEALNDDCMKRKGNLSVTMEICAARDQLYSALQLHGWCHGKHGQGTAEMKWHNCQTDSIKNNLADYITLAPSFLCEKNVIGAQATICHNKQISTLDSILNGLYQHGIQGTYGFRIVPDDSFPTQELWIKNVRDNCKDEKCLIIEYGTRIYEIGLVLAR